MEVTRYHVKQLLSHTSQWFPIAFLTAKVWVWGPSGFLHKSTKPTSIVQAKFDSV